MYTCFISLFINFQVYEAHSSFLEAFAGNSTDIFGLPTDSVGLDPTTAVSSSFA